jgi:hypothetical protein
VIKRYGSFVVLPLENASCCVLIQLNFELNFRQHNNIKSTHSHLLCIIEFNSCIKLLQVSAHLQPSSGDTGTLAYYWHMHSIWIHILFTFFREQLVLSVNPVLSLITILKILMIQMWIVLKLIPRHDLNKIWLKLKLIYFSSGETDTLRLRLPFYDRLICNQLYIFMQLLNSSIHNKCE